MKERMLFVGFMLLGVYGTLIAQFALAVPLSDSWPFLMGMAPGALAGIYMIGEVVQQEGKP